MPDSTKLFWATSIIDPKILSDTEFIRKEFCENGMFDARRVTLKHLRPGLCEFIKSAREYFETVHIHTAPVSNVLSFPGLNGVMDSEAYFESQDDAVAFLSKAKRYDLIICSYPCPDALPRVNPLVAIDAPESSLVKLDGHNGPLLLQGICDSFELVYDYYSRKNRD